jgi:hypothetical protein
MTGVYYYEMAGKPLWRNTLAVYPLRGGWGTGRLR